MFMKRTTAIAIAAVLFCAAGWLAFSSTSADSLTDSYDCGSVLSRNGVPQRSSVGAESVGHRCASDLDERALWSVGLVVVAGGLVWVSRREGWLVGA